MWLRWVEFALLELGAENAGDLLVVGDGVEAGDADAAGVGDAQAPDALDGGGLADAVRAEDPEDLALLDGEGDTVDGRTAPVGLAQTGDVDDGHGSSVAAPGAPAHRPVRSDRCRPIG